MHPFRFSGHTAVANLSTILTGVLVGITAFGVQQSIEHLADLRNTALQQFFLLDVGQAVGVWAGISLVFVTFAGALVHLFAPKAAGAGVPPVMAFLNGVDIPGLLSLPVLVLKIFGLVCVRVANLAVGPEVGGWGKGCTARHGKYFGQTHCMLVLLARSLLPPRCFI